MSDSRGQSEKYPQRKFTGIWIPVEIWENPNIPLMAKLLWAEILALSGKGDCWASNAYLSKVLRIHPRKIQENLKILKDNGLVIQTRFDGRKRFLKSLYLNEIHTRDAGNGTAEMTPTAPIDNSREQTKEKETIKEKVSVSSEELKIPKHITERPGLKLVRSNVYLTENEQKDLESFVGSLDVLNRILDELNDYIISTGKKYRNHTGTIRNWYRLNEAKYTELVSREKAW